MKGSTEPSGNVFLGLRLSGIRKDFRGAIDFDQTPKIKKRGVIRTAASLLHVVGDNHNRVLLLELTDQFLNFRRRDRIERRTWFVHQHNLGLDCQGARDAKTLLLAAGKAVT